ncbi:MAG: hypothetical protein US50_C0012G0015 [Candidatus Nomurabacteria bacterium GW2011_GWB1_37_5]|uniref:Uncharacterized protein n=1 Tax=Candidatus Nomurabacteria bacterium GW2011_GWB1_37_5 TaxID=1618742 RepID=A0A0G0HAH7_9BACT|nr:MAG: hypothetical protein US50_C0012G0015 [Candidatus Nomurabacteria bacterium GW2011_GWB1_37_5]
MEKIFYQIKFSSFILKNDILKILNGKNKSKKLRVLYKDYQDSDYGHFHGSNKKIYIKPKEKIIEVQVY